MVGFFNTKYHIAIYDRNLRCANKIARILKTYFNNKVIVESYTDSYAMFVDLNVAKVKNNPFDATVIGPSEGPEAAIILKQSNPNMEVINYKNDSDLRKNAERIKHPVI